MHSPAWLAVAPREKNRFDGTILFVVGLALIRAHNRWAWRWPTFITVIGWVFLVGGLYRMIVPEAPQAHANAGSYAMFAAMVVIGLFLSFKGYGSEAVQSRVQNQRFPGNSEC